MRGCGVFWRALMMVDDLLSCGGRDVFLKVRPDEDTERCGDALIDALGDVGPHAVIDASAGEDDFGLVAELEGAVGEVEGVDADAMAADEAGVSAGSSIGAAASRTSWR